MDDSRRSNPQVYLAKDETGDGPRGLVATERNSSTRPLVSRFLVTTLFISVRPVEGAGLPIYIAA